MGSRSYLDADEGRLSLASQVRARWLRLLRWFGLYRDTFLPDYDNPTQVIDMSEVIRMLDPDTSQFTTLLHWSEDVMMPRFTVVKPLWGEWDWVD